MDPKHTFSVPDMSCDHCVNALNTEIGRVDGVESVEVDLDAKLVAVVGGDSSDIVAAIDRAGFDVA